MQLTEVIKRPVITEKSHRSIEEQNEYTLVVDEKADKNLIARAVQELFGVEVLEIRTIKMPSKTRRVGKRRFLKKITGFKKAIVRLPQGQKIPLFEFEAE